MKKILIPLILLSLFSMPTFGADSISEIRVRNQPYVDGNKNLVVLTAFQTGDGLTTRLIDPALVEVLIDDKRIPINAIQIKLLDSACVLIQVDTSLSMKPIFSELQKALIQYMNLTGSVVYFYALGEIGNQWKKVTAELTRDRDTVQTQIKQLKVNSNLTALFESIQEGSDWMYKQGNHLPGRRFLLVFSDGLNDKKAPTKEQVISTLRENKIDVHFIIYSKNDPQANNQLADPREIAKESAGIYYQTDDKEKFHQGLSKVNENLSNEMTILIPGSELPQDGKQHTLKIAYQGKEAFINFTAPLTAVVETPMEPEKKEAPAVDAPPAAPVKKEKTNWMVWVLAGAGVLLLGAAFFIMYINKKRREEEAKQAELARLEAERAARNKPEPVVLEARRTPSGSMPAVDEKKSAAPEGARRTSFEPDAKAAVSRLVPLTGYEGPAITLPAGSPVLGADGSCDIVLDVRSVSGRHAQFVTTSRGLAVRDLGSTNGTFVDGVKIGADPVDLHAGSKLQFGVVVFRCE